MHLEQLAPMEGIARDRAAHAARAIMPRPVRLELLVGVGVRLRLRVGVRVRVRLGLG